MSIALGSCMTIIALLGFVALMFGAMVEWRGPDRGARGRAVGLGLTALGWLYVASVVLMAIARARGGR